MKPSPNTLPPGSQSTDATSRSYTPGLSDGLGDRLMTFDSATQSSVELLRFKREFSDAPGFEEALRARIDELSSFKHGSIAQVRGVQTIEGGLAVASSNTAGRRLSEMVHVARGVPFAMDLIQQLAPALAALHAQGGRIAHGLLTAERIIITREGRLIVVEHVLASAFEQLRLPSPRLRTEFGIAVPLGSDPVALNQKSDVVQLGFLALSLLLGRRLDPAHYPANITTLLDEFTHADGPGSARLRPWLERALQVSDKSFSSAQEAHHAFSTPASGVKVAKPVEPEPQSSTSAATPVLAFRPTDAAGTKPKTDAPKTESHNDAADAKKDSFDPANALTPSIGLQKLDIPNLTPSRVPIASVASPRAKSGSMKWILIAVVGAGIVAGGLYFSGMFSGNKPAASTQPDASNDITKVTNPAPPPFRPPQNTPVPSTPPVEPTAVPLTSGSASSSSSTPSGSLAASVGAGATGGSSKEGSTKPATPPPSQQGSSGDQKSPAVGGIGGVKVNAPVELQVFENGNLVGSSSGQIAVLAGSHNFELVNESLAFRVRTAVTVKGGQMTPLNVNLPNGRLSLNAVPWADVTIDGKPVGQTPLANLPVMIGEHVVVFKHPQFGEQQQKVIVKADGVARASATFKQQ